MFRATPGKLPAGDSAVVAGIALPPGRLVASQESPGGTVAWISAEPLPVEQLNEQLQALAAAFPQTGLWPLRAEGSHGRGLAQPWFDGEMGGPETELPDALEVVSRKQFEEPTVPLATALAPGVPGPDLDLHALHVDEPGALLLVPVARPADVPAALGWWGGTNYDLSGADFTAVLRSWEDRFGAVLISIGFDTMTVRVGRRPVTDEQIDALLSEHYGFCPDNIDQGTPAETFRGGLAHWIYWNFWWD
jgi:hypothetical protein